MICVVYLKNRLNAIAGMWWAWLENRSAEQRLRAVTAVATRGCCLAKQPWRGKPL